MADFFSRVSINTRNLTNTVKSSLSAMDMFTFNVSLSVMVLVLFVVCGYLIYSYNLMNEQLDKLKDFAEKARSLGRVYSATPFDEDLFERLVMEALEVLRNSVSTISQPYFHAQKIEDIVKTMPGYVKVLRFAKYVYDHPDTKNDAIHKVLVKYYGRNYNKSTQITYDVTIQINPTYNRTYKHSILVDMSKSQYMYKKNITKANALLSQADASASKK